MEFVVTTGIRSCRDLTGRDLKPTAVHFVHRRSKKPSELENYFGCRVSFGAEADRISFDKKAGQLPVVRADPYLEESAKEGGRKQKRPKEASRLA
jgi:hypothetical protein